MNENKKGKSKADSGSKDIFARTLALLSLIVAILSVAIPYYQQSANYSESLIITLEGIYNDSEIKVNVTGNSLMGDERVVCLPWRLSISNEGFTRVSISDYAFVGLFEAARHHCKPEELVGRAKPESITLPFSLAPGEIAVDTLYFAVAPPDEALAVIDSLPSTHTFEEMRPILGHAGTDLIGNNILFSSASETGYVYGYYGSIERKEYHYIVITGRGNSFRGHSERGRNIWAQ